MELAIKNKLGVKKVGIEIKYEHIFGFAIGRNRLTYIEWVIVLPLCVINIEYYPPKKK
jgi:hypothetical protein|tara:strand:- start:246 stop:419 length:174 start_codon:yes stop_codon:yes gene_type:complete